MSSFQIIFLLSVLLYSIRALQHCIEEDAVCPMDTDDLLDTVFKIASPTECQEHCQDTAGCKHWDWYGGGPLFQTCFLMSRACDNPAACQPCASGPPSCGTCSIDHVTCIATGDNFINIFSDVTEENTCKAVCSDAETCSFYTWRDPAHPTLPSTCILFSSCDDYAACPTCWTGPRECGNKEPCKKGEAGWSFKVFHLQGSWWIGVERLRL